MDGSRLAPCQQFQVLRHFIGGYYAGCAGYPMVDCNIIDIGLCIIKQCGMYAKEYKA
jgi:hypothetical protein